MVYFLIPKCLHYPTRFGKSSCEFQERGCGYLGKALLQPNSTPKTPSADPAQMECWRRKLLYVVNSDSSSSANQGLMTIQTTQRGQSM